MVRRLLIFAVAALAPWQAWAQSFGTVAGDATGNNWTIYLAGAAIDGQPLQSGDQIALFDGPTLVGSKTLTAPLTPETQFANFVTAWELLTDGPGYTPGNAWQFRFYDASAGRRMSVLTPTLTDPGSVGAYVGTTFPATDGAFSIATLTTTSPGIVLEPVTEFAVTVATKDASHPQFGVGSSIGFVVDGVQGATLYLARGVTYTFAVNGTTGHPFYISTDASGAGAGVVSDGIGGDGNFITDGQLLFTPTAGTPDLLYYQCQNHVAMGWEIHVVDGPASGLVTSESGTTARVAVSLRTPPATAVTLTVASLDAGEGAASASLVFDADDFDQPQVVTVTGVGDAVDDGLVLYTVRFTVSSAAEDYAGLVAETSVGNFDDDLAAFFITDAGPGVPEQLDIAAATVPTQVTVNEGGSLDFYVAVGGTIAEPFTFVWTIDGVVFGSSNTAQLAPDFDSVAHPAAQLTAEVRCTATNGVGDVATATWTAIIVTDVDRLPDPPTVGITPTSPLTNAALTASVGQQSADPDGDPISHQFSWQLLPGRAAIAGAVLGAANTRRGDRWEVTVLPTTKPYGVIRVDGPAATAQVVVGNSLPTAAALAAAAVNAGDAVLQLPGSDLDAADGVDTLIYSIVTGPSQGQLSGFNPLTGLLTYRPDPDATGSDTFTYKVTDDTGANATATVSLAIGGWSLALAVAGAQVDTLRLGMYPGASDGRDLGLDGTSPPAAPASGYAVFSGLTPPLFQDIRNEAESGIWYLSVDARASAGDVVMSWDVAAVPASGLTIGGTTVAAADMRELNRVVISAGTRETLTILRGVVGFSLTLAPGWNLISVPLQPPNTAVDAVLAGAGIVDAVYAWDGTKYVVTPVIEPKSGYFVFNRGAAATLLVFGDVVDDQTISVGAQWAMVGPVAAPPFAPQAPGDVLTPFVASADALWSYDGLRYQMAQSLLAGRGYWVLRPPP